MSNDKCILNGLNIVLKLSFENTLVREMSYRRILLLPYTDNQLDYIKDRLILLTQEINSLNLNNLEQSVDEMKNEVEKINRDRRARTRTE